MEGDLGENSEMDHTLGEIGRKWIIPEGKRIVHIQISPLIERI